MNFGAQPNPAVMFEMVSQSLATIIAIKRAGPLATVGGAALVTLWLAYAWMTPAAVFALPVAAGVLSVGESAADLLPALGLKETVGTRWDTIELTRFAIATTVGMCALVTGAQAAYLHLSFAMWSLDLLLYITIRRDNPDAPEMLLHHILTLLLIAGASYTGAVGYGATVQLLHDSSDNFVSLMKLMHHAEVPGWTEATFTTVVVVVWPVFRVWWIGGLIPEGFSIGLIWGTLIAFIWAMQLWWWTVMLRIGYKIAMGATINDAADAVDATIHDAADPTTEPPTAPKAAPKAEPTAAAPAVAPVVETDVVVPDGFPDNDG